MNKRIYVPSDAPIINKTKISLGLENLSDYYEAKKTGNCNSDSVQRRDVSSYSDLCRMNSLLLRKLIAPESAVA